jgi:Ca-activated chloride channel family protein
MKPDDELRGLADDELDLSEIEWLSELLQEAADLAPPSLESHRQAEILRTPQAPPLLAWHQHWQVRTLVGAVAALLLLVFLVRPRPSADPLAALQREQAIIEEKLTALEGDRAFWQEQLARNRAMLEKLEPVADSAAMGEDYGEFAEKSYIQAKVKYLETRLAEADLSTDEREVLQADLQQWLARENGVVLPETTLLVTIAEDEPLSGRYKVRPGGYILMPRLPRIFVAGKTVREAEEVIQQELKAQRILDSATVQLEVAHGQPPAKPVAAAMSMIVPGHTPQEQQTWEQNSVAERGERVSAQAQAFETRAEAVVAEKAPGSARQFDKDGDGLTVWFAEKHGEVDSLYGQSTNGTQPAAEPEVLFDEAVPHFLGDRPVVAGTVVAGRTSGGLPELSTPVTGTLFRRDGEAAKAPEDDYAWEAGGKGGGGGNGVAPDAWPAAGLENMPPAPKKPSLKAKGKKILENSKLVEHSEISVGYADDLSTTGAGFSSGKDEVVTADAGALLGVNADVGGERRYFGDYDAEPLDVAGVLVQQPTNGHSAIREIPPVVSDSRRGRRGGGDGEAKRFSRAEAGIELKGKALNRHLGREFAGEEAEQAPTSLSWETVVAGDGARPKSATKVPAKLREQQSKQLAKESEGSDQSAEKALKDISATYFGHPAALDEVADLDVLAPDDGPVSSVAGVKSGNKGVSDWSEDSEQKWAFRLGASHRDGDDVIDSSLTHGYLNGAAHFKGSDSTLVLNNTDAKSQQGGQGQQVPSAKAGITAEIAGPESGQLSEPSARGYRMKQEESLRRELEVAEAEPKAKRASELQAKLAKTKKLLSPGGGSGKIAEDDYKTYSSVEGLQVRINELTESRQGLHSEAAYAKSVDLPPAPSEPAPPVNPFVLTEKDALSTFALESEAASYVLSRRYIRAGYQPPPAIVRMEEFVNAFDYNYPEDTGSRTFAVHASAAPAPFGKGLTLLKIGVRGKVIGRDGRKPAHLVFVIDASGSMARPDRLPMVRESLAMLLSQMGSEDKVSLVSYASRAHLLLDGAPVAQRDHILATIDRIACTAATNVLDGVRLGYQLAARHFRPNAVNRVILCSDGVANVGPDDANAMLQMVQEQRQQGIAITTVGVGAGSYNDNLMEQLANRGDGNYVYIDTLAEAKRVFVDNFSATLNTIARDVKIQVAFNPDRVRRYRLIGYENRAVKDQDFRNDKVDAGEIGSGQSATALYELELHEGAEAEDLGTVFLRYKEIDDGRVTEFASRLRADLPRRRTPAEDPRFFVAAAVAEFAEILRQSPHAKRSTLYDVEQLLLQSSQALPHDSQVAELLRLVRAAKDQPVFGQ